MENDTIVTENSDNATTLLILLMIICIVIGMMIYYILSEKYQYVKDSMNIVRAKTIEVTGKDITHVVGEIVSPKITSVESESQSTPDILTPDIVPSFDENVFVKKYKNIDSSEIKKNFVSSDTKITNDVDYTDIYDDVDSEHLLMSDNAQLDQISWKLFVDKISVEKQLDSSS